jgi:hypothetical protein
VLEDAEIGREDGEAQALLALSQSLFRHLPLGDVRGDTEDAKNLTVRAPEGHLAREVSAGDTCRRERLCSWILPPPLSNT